MADTKITVKTQALKDAAAEIDTHIQVYRQHYKELFGYVQALSGVAWDDDASRAYNRKIREFEGDFESMCTLMLSYKTFLEDAARSYENVEAQNTQIANTMAKR